MCQSWPRVTRWLVGVLISSFQTMACTQVPSVWCSRDLTNGCFTYHAGITFFAVFDLFFPPWPKVAVLLDLKNSGKFLDLSTLHVPLHKDSRCDSCLSDSENSETTTPLLDKLHCECQPSDGCLELVNEKPANELSLLSVLLEHTIIPCRW